MLLIEDRQDIAQHGKGVQHRSVAGQQRFRLDLRQAELRRAVWSRVEFGNLQKQLGMRPLFWQPT